jgi:hypothetical protein
MYSFVPPFRKATFCGVLSCVFDKSGCAVGEKRLQNTVLVHKRYAKKVYRCSGGEVACTVNLSTRWQRVASFTPATLPQGKKPGLEEWWASEPVWM